MSNEVKRYIVASKDAHDFDLERIGPLAHERLMVCDTDYAALEAECERLRDQVQALQSDANSWQSGYDKGRIDGARFGRAERNALAAELAAIRAAGGGDLHDHSWTIEGLDEQIRVVRLSDAQRIVAAMAAELEKWRQQFACMQLQRDHHRNTAKVLRAELEAARKQSPIGHVALGSHTGVVFYSHMPQLPDGTKLYALPPLAGKVSVPRELLERILDDYSDDKPAIRAELRALLATPSMGVKS